MCIYFITVNIDTKFEDVEKKLNTVDTKLEEVDDKLTIVDNKVEDVKDNLTTVDSILDNVDTDLGEVKIQLAQMTESKYSTVQLLVSKVCIDSFSSCMVQILTLHY